MPRGTPKNDSLGPRGVLFSFCALRDMALVFPEAPAFCPKHLYTIAIVLQCMTKQVAFADRTYERLKSARREGESFSETVERLLDSSKDPLSFLRSTRSRIDATRRLKAIRADRDASRVDA